MHYALTSQSQEYFNVRGHEWPTMLVEMAEWMLDTNACIDGISFSEQLDAPGGAYISATVNHSSTYTKIFEDPFGHTNELKAQLLRAIINDLQETLDEVHG